MTPFHRNNSRSRRTGKPAIHREHGRWYVASSSYCDQRDADSARSWAWVRNDA